MDSQITRGKRIKSRRGLPDSTENRLELDLSNYSKGMVIALHPEHCQAILEGRKSIEFRRERVDNSNTADIAFLYETSPTKSIVGIATIDKIEHLPIEDLWTLARKYTPSEKASFFDYFEGTEEGSAIFFEEVHELSMTVPLLSEDGSSDHRFTPPQSYYYVDPADFVSGLSETV